MAYYKDKKVFFSLMKGEKGDKGDTAISRVDETRVSASTNLINPETVSDIGNWCNYANGEFQSYPNNQYISAYRHSDYIEVKPNTHYTHSGKIYAHSVCFFDEKKTFIIGVLNSAYSSIFSMVSPENARYAVINYAVEGAHLSAQFEEGTEASEYTPYSSDYYLQGLKIKQSQIEKGDEETSEIITGSVLKLPKQFDLVVGDAFELFYKGIMLCKDPYAYYIQATCDIGKAYGRKFVATPTTAGTYPLTIKLYDDSGKAIDSGTVNLVVKEKMSRPAEQINILCVGDSLTNNGEWVGEFCRRLTATSDRTAGGETAMVGDGFTNISFIGKKSTDWSNGAKFEGFGGWTFENYLSTANSTSNYWVTATHSKTDNDQESIYADENGVQWQLETIESGKLKFKKYSGSGSLPWSGTLTWVSGGVDTTTISYTKATLEVGNPFVYNSVVDFSAYCRDLGVDTIDCCYILLGWNNTNTSETDYKAMAKQFIDKLIAFNANMKIVLLGLEIPAMDGLANNYGAKNIPLCNYRKMQEYVFNMNERYQAIADEYPSNVSFVNIAGQFDTENNMMTMDEKLNERNAETVKVQSNGIHPAVKGYMQIADASYRKFNNLF